MIPISQPDSRIRRVPVLPLRAPAGLGLILALGLLGSGQAQGAGDAGEVSENGQRSRIVESTLKDLSTGNEAAIDRSRISITPGKDSLGAPRTELTTQPPTDAATAVDASVQSSLHKLKRETVSEKTADGRRARVDDSLQRAGEATSDER